jgi:lactoylglutathione lyase
MAYFFGNRKAGSRPRLFLCLRQQQEGLMTLKFGDVRVLVADYGTAFRFYRDVLSLPLTWGDTESGYAQFKVDGLTLTLLTRTAMAEVLGRDLPASSPSSVLCFTVPNVDEAYSVLIGRGSTPVREPRDQADWGYRVAHIADPDGNLIELYSAL